MLLLGKTLGLADLKVSLDILLDILTPVRSDKRRRAQPNSFTGPLVHRRNYVKMKVELWIGQQDCGPTYDRSVDQRTRFMHVIH
jgi:hypothetical protein